jgi:hypothetical protein
MSEQAVIQRWGPQRATPHGAASEQITPDTHPD